MLGNKFSRFFTIRQSQALARWREAVDYAKKREQLLRNSVAHIQKRRLLQVKSAWHNWRAAAREKDQKEVIHRKEVENTEMRGAIQRDYANFERKVNEVQEEMVRAEQEGDKLEKRIAVSIAQITQRAQTQFYMSRKRYLLNAWRQFVRKEKRACRDVKKKL